MNRSGINSSLLTAPRPGRRQTRESSSGDDQRDWLGRGADRGGEVPMRVSSEILFLPIYEVKIEEHNCSKS